MIICICCVILIMNGGLLMCLLCRWVLLCWMKVCCLIGCVIVLFVILGWLLVKLIGSVLW